jgi:hypothetical protein
MVRAVTVVLAFYAVSMVCYGSLEMSHDFLHYLADHHHTSLHSHHHGASHSVRDHEHSHQHSHVAHEHDSEEVDDAAPSPLNFFLYTQLPRAFRFSNASGIGIFPGTSANTSLPELTPPAPPPRKIG